MNHSLRSYRTTARMLALLLTLIFLLCSCKKDSSQESESNISITAFTDSQAGDDTVDPENAEIMEEDGADVNADELTAESGISNGIDVSKWQGKIDWQRVKNSGIEFAFIRIGYRGENGKIYRDDNADYNIQQAQKVGVLVGVYFFSTAVNESEAAEEAQWTLQAIKGYSISYPVVYDCEGFRNDNSRMHEVTAGERTKNALAFLDTVSEAGYDAMLYGARNELLNPLYWQRSQIEEKYKLWIAQYPETTYPKKAKPDYIGRCDAWQYTDKGTVSGIDGNVDMVVCYFTKEETAPKDKNAAPGTAAAPLTEEEKLYTAVNETVTAKDATNLRRSATTKSDIVTTLKNGQTVTRTGIGSNGWSKLSYNGQTVYAITSYLTTDLSFETPAAPSQDIVSGNTFEPKNDSVTAKEKVNLRTLPTTDSDVVYTLKSGEFLERTAVSNKGWSRLIYNGQTVYAVTSYLTDKVITPEPETSQPESDGFTAVDEQVTAKVETNLRSAPSTADSQVIYTLKNGEYVRRIGIHTNGWSKLEYNGQTVYAITSYLTE